MTCVLCILLLASWDKIKPVALSIVELCLVEDISQLVENHLNRNLIVSWKGLGLNFIESK